MCRHPSGRAVPASFSLSLGAAVVALVAPGCVVPVSEGGDAGDAGADGGFAAADGGADAGWRDGGVPDAGARDGGAACGLLQQDCPDPGFACYPLTGLPARCLPAGTGIDGQPCQSNTDCARGLFCSPGDRRCFRLCDLAGGPPACLPGWRCDYFWTAPFMPGACAPNGDGGADGGPCGVCPAAGAARCSLSAPYLVEVCGVDSSGCLGWTTTYPCLGAPCCQGACPGAPDGGRDAGCGNPCACPGAWGCGSGLPDIYAECVRDPSGDCFVWQTGRCPTGMMCDPRGGCR